VRSRRRFEPRSDSESTFSSGLLQSFPLREIAVRERSIVLDCCYY
jgi:hypothetical protein